MTGRPADPLAPKNNDQKKRDKRRKRVWACAGQGSTMARIKKIMLAQIKAGQWEGQRQCRGGECPLIEMIPNHDEIPTFRRLCPHLETTLRNSEDPLNVRKESKEKQIGRCHFKSSVTCVVSPTT